MTNKTRTGIVLLVLAQGLAGCGPSPSAPSPATQSVPLGQPVPAPQPVSVAPSAPALNVAGISPNTGSTDGGTSIEITGTGIQAGATVTLDGIPHQAKFDHRYPNNIYLETSAHAAGTVDVTVTNPGGHSGRLAAGYTYASPQSFDFNGNWLGEIPDGSHRFLKFTIQNNLLVSFSCESSTGTSTLALSPPPSIAGGEFSFLGNDGVSVSGRIVSPHEATGTINSAPCSGARWRAFLF